MLVDVIVMGAVEVAVMQVVDVTGVHHRGVTTVWAVHMVVALVYPVRFHLSSNAKGS